MPDSSSLVLRALDPSRSVVVEACAGSGKTWLLASRVVRLLAGRYRVRVLEELRRRVDSGAGALLVVTHDEQVAAGAARTVELVGGRVAHDVFR